MECNIFMLNQKNKVGMSINYQDILKDRFSNNKDNSQCVVCHHIPYQLQALINHTKEVKPNMDKEKIKKNLIYQYFKIKKWLAIVNVYNFKNYYFNQLIKEY